MTCTTINTKLLFMHIIVTCNTITHIPTDKILEHPIGAHLRIMTLRTGDRAVLSFEWKSGFIVIEVFHPAKEMERFLDVALLTVCPKSADVRIFMTTVAVDKCDSGKFLKR
jgi:hypothetical protein